MPPGPSRPLIGTLLWPGRDPLALFTRFARTYGDVTAFRMAGAPAFLITRPEDIRDVLVTQQRNFTKSLALERARRYLGEGLLTSEGATHLRHRRLLQPRFHRDRVAGYASVMVEYADRLGRGWRDGETRDVARDMMRLALSIASKALFDVDVGPKADEVGGALTQVMESFWLTLLPFADVLERLPLPAVRRAIAARDRLDALVYDMIAERRREGDRGDLLSMMLMAEDPLAGGGTAAGLTDREVRDEAMTLLLAGHETTANALAWTWHLLGQAPDVAAALYAEIDRVLEGRLPTFDDLPSLGFVEQVVTESMRLYPPAWVIGRRAIADCAIGSFVVPARGLVFMSPWVTHRDPRFYPEPDRFRPERWTAAFKAQLPRFAYFPFGGGARQCIGEPFAWMELVLVVATLARQWTFSPAAGHPVVPRPLLTLRPKHGVTMTLRRRTQGAT